MRIQQDYVILHKQESSEVKTASGLVANDNLGSTSRFEFWEVKEVAKNCKEVNKGDRVMIGKGSGKLGSFSELTRNNEDREQFKLVRETEIIIVFNEEN